MHLLSKIIDFLCSKMQNVIQISHIQSCPRKLIIESTNFHQLLILPETLQLLNENRCLRVTAQIRSSPKTTKEHSDKFTNIITHFINSQSLKERKHSIHVSLLFHLFWCQSQSQKTFHSHSRCCPSSASVVRF